MAPRILYPLCSINPIRIGKAPSHGQWRQNASDLFVGFRQKHSHQIDAQRRQGQHGNPSCQPTPANGRPPIAPLDLSVHSSDLLRAEVAHTEVGRSWNSEVRAEGATSARWERAIRCVQANAGSSVPPVSKRAVSRRVSPTTACRENRSVEGAGYRHNYGAASKKSLSVERLRPKSSLERYFMPSGILGWPTRRSPSYTLTQRPRSSSPAVDRASGRELGNLPICATIAGIARLGEPDGPRSTHPGHNHRRCR